MSQIRAAAPSSYVRGGYLTRIEYGTRAGSESGNAPARVEFTVAERCLPSGSITCAASQLTSANARHWPDVPFDLICTSSTTCPDVTSPAFFTRKRLTAVTTKVLDGSSYRTVDSVALEHQFPDPGDGTDPVLWLASIQHTGHTATPAITLPKTTFLGTQMPNRVDSLGDYGPPMNRYRITGINTDTGGAISVNYTGIDCTPSNLPSAPHTNTRRCFPINWTPEGLPDPVEEYFHKYLVTSVIADGRDTESLATETHYTYVGGAAWKYDDSELTPEDQRTWGIFRGYATVDVTVGAPGTSNRLKSRYRYFRGMHGDKLPSGTRSVAVDGIADHDRYNGILREEITYNGTAGSEVMGILHTPWQSPATATGSNGTRSRYVGVRASETRKAAPDLPGGIRTTRVNKTFDDAYGVVTQIEDLGDVSTPADDWCARIEYVRNASKHILDKVQRTETVSVRCGVAPSRPGHIISDTRNLFDGGSYGDAPIRGLVTATQDLKSYNGSVPIYVTLGSGTYDARGRQTSTTDALGRSTSTTYTPANGALATAVTVTSEDPDGSGPLTAHVSKVELGADRGLPHRTIDPNGKIASATYDALGRRAQVWLPGRQQGIDSPNTRYTYTIRTDGANAVTTEELIHDGSYVRSTDLFDGLLRARQTQTPSASKETPGRVITDQIYDSRGLLWRANHPWYTTGTPATTPIGADATAVPARTRYIYDGAGRTTATILDIAEQEHSRTTTAHGGDREHVTPPEGGTAQSTIVDGRGQVVELRQYSNPTPTGGFDSTLYEYDPAGRLAKMVDPAGNVWESEYDLLGREILTRDPDKGETTYVYDDAGQQISSTDARGETLAKVYDRLGRGIEIREGGSTGPLRATWTFDTLEKGKLANSSQYHGEEQYETSVTAYDDGYRPLGQSVTIPPGEGALAGTYTTTYTYTLDGQLRSINNPATGNLGPESQVTYFDSTSRPEWMSGGFGWGVYVAGTEYSPYGELLVMDAGSTYSKMLNHSYEHGTRRLDRTWIAREGAPGYDLDLTYTRDKAGNLTSIVDEPTGKPMDAQCFAYDHLRRLTEAWTPASADCIHEPNATSLGGPAPYWTSWTFDKLGNRLTETHREQGRHSARIYTYPVAGAPQPHAVTQVAETLSDGPATTSNYTYDAAGNTTVREIPGEEVQHLTWNPEGKLATIEEAGNVVGEYIYNADGDRIVRRQNGATTVYLPGGQELTLDHSTGGLSTVRYYSFVGQTIAMRTAFGASGSNTLVADHHGTAELAYNNGTNALIQRRHDPFGNPRGDGGPTWPGDHGFLDKPTDASGLTHIGARYYDPRIGRFVSVDPVIDLTDPQQWQAYSYANNNPTTWSDPTGLVPFATMDGLFFDGRGAQTAKDNDVSPPRVYVQPVSNFQAGAGSGSGGNGLPGPRAPYQPYDPQQPWIPHPTAENCFVWGNCTEQMLYGATGEIGAYHIVETMPPQHPALSALNHFLISLTPMGIVMGCFPEGASAADCFGGAAIGVAGVVVTPLKGGQAAAAGGNAARAGAGARAGTAAGATTNAATRLSPAFGKLKHASLGIDKYSVMRKHTAGQKGTVQAHHLIEKRFSRAMGDLDTDDWMTVVLTKDEHQVFTNAWRAEFPYGAGTARASKQGVEDAARRIYADYPEFLDALGLG